MSVEIRACLTDDEISATFPVMSQLRPHIAEADYLGFVRAVMADGGRLIAAFEDGRCVGCCLFREQMRLATGHMIYVDDLVTDASARSGGIGKALLAWVEAEARRLGIGIVTLDSGTQRQQAHRFYLREGFVIASFNFKKTIA